MKIAVITPYCNEPDDVLRRCVASVEAQNIPCRHYLVADGNTREWIEAKLNTGVHRHLRLGEAHHDFGNTPRTLGALLAISEGAEAVGFLDADNTADPDHLELCLAAAKSAPAVDYVIARRRITLPDGTRVANGDEPVEDHVDTSCFFVLRRTFHTVPQWILQPSPLSNIGDRAYLKLLQYLKLIFAMTMRPSITYVSNWRNHYIAAGRTPPADAKPTIEMKNIPAWWGTLSEDEKEIIRRHLGMPVSF